MGGDPVAAPELNEAAVIAFDASRVVGIRAGACRVVWCSFALAVLTGLGVIVALVDPSLVSAGKPRAVLHPTLVAILSILATNLRVLAAPFVLAAFRFSSSRCGRVLGDLIVGGILVGNALWIGLALGRWQGQLIRFVPQLPLEYLAASTSATAWLDARWRGTKRPDVRTSCSYAALAVLLLVSAAIVEVRATPHAH